MTKHVRRQHGGRPRSTDGESSDDEGMDSYGSSQSTRPLRNSSASTLPSQDLSVHYTKRLQHPHIPHPHHHHHPQHHPQHHLSVSNSHPRPHHPQAVYLSPNPSSAGSQVPPMYYAPPGGYPHTPNSIVHREIDEDYDSTSGTDGMTGEPNPYHRLQMQQPKYPTQQYHHSHSAAGPYSHANGDHVAYYSPSLPTPAVSPASSCSGPNLPPPAQYSQSHHSPPASGGGSQHQPTPYQAPPPPNPHNPQPIHYATAYGNGHNRLYGMNGDGGVDNSGVPRLHQHSPYSSSQNMSMGTEGTHGLGISMGGPSMKVEVSTPMGTAW